MNFNFKRVQKGSESLVDVSGPHASVSDSVVHFNRRMMDEYDLTDGRYTFYVDEEKQAFALEKGDKYGYKLTKNNIARPKVTRGVLPNGIYLPIETDDDRIVFVLEEEKETVEQEDEKDELPSSFTPEDNREPIANKM